MSADEVPQPPCGISKPDKHATRAASSALSRRSSLRSATKDVVADLSESTTPAISTAPSASTSDVEELTTSLIRKSSATASTSVKRSRSNTKGEAAAPNELSIVDASLLEEKASVKLDIARHEKDARKFQVKARQAYGKKLAAEAKLYDVKTKMLVAGIRNETRKVDDKFKKLEVAHLGHLAVAGSDDIDFNPRLTERDSSDTEDIVENVPGPSSGRRRPVSSRT